MPDASDSVQHREIQNLKAENERLHKRFLLLSDVSRRITSSLDVSIVLQEVIDAACQLTSARYGALAVFDALGQIQQFITHGISLEERERIGDLPKGLGILGLLQEVEMPVRLADLSKHTRSVGFPSNHPPMKTFLGAPILIGEERLGNLYLTEKDCGEEFTPEDESLLSLFAAQAAMAIRNARLYYGVESERSRMDAILSNSPDCILFIDATMGEIQANKRAKDVLGLRFEAGEGVGSLLGKYLSLDGTSLPVEALPSSRALKGEYVTGEEHLIGSDDNAPLPVLCSAAPVRGAEGEVIGAVVQFQDMTSVKESERVLREMVLFPQLNPGPVLRIDDRGVIKSSNLAAMEILGDNATEGTPVALLLPSFAQIDLKRCIEHGLILYNEAQFGEGHFQLTVRGVPEYGFAHVYCSDCRRSAIMGHI